MVRSFTHRLTLHNTPYFHYLSAHSVLPHKKISIAGTLRVAGFALVCIIYFGALLLTIKLTERPTVSFDEAGQFLIAKGKYHYCDWDMPEGGVEEVLYYNARYNLDPGGYSVFLHFWTRAYDLPFWIKLPSAVFLWLASLLIVGYMKKRSTGTLLALSAGLLPLLITPVFTLAMQIRAYGLELLGVVLCLFFLGATREKHRSVFYLMWGLLFAVLCTSRYAAVMTTVITLFLIFRRSGFRTGTSFVERSMLILPVLLSIAGIWFFTFSVQNSSFQTRANGPYLSDEPSLLITSFYNVLLLLSLAALVFILLRPVNKKLTPFHDLFRLSLLVNSAFIILSFLGLHPWSVNDQHIVSGVLLMALSLTAIAFVYLRTLFPKSRSTVLTLGVPLLLLAIIYLRRDAIYAPFHQKDIYHELVATDFEQYHKVFVGFELAAVFNYHYNYGVLINELPSDFKSKFHFDKGIEHRNKPVKQIYQTIQERRGNLNSIIDEGYDLRISNPWTYVSDETDRWILKEDSRFLYVPLK